MASTRQNQVRNAKRCLADLFGGHVWKYTLARVRQSADYVISMHQAGLYHLAADEVETMRTFAEEYRWQREETRRLLDKCQQ